MIRNCAAHISEKHFRNLPPPTKARLTEILTEHTDEILSCRASILQDRRGDGRMYWRLYLESSSGPDRWRQRHYIGTQGGLELRQAIRELREAFWGDCGGADGFMKALAAAGAKELRELRRAARKAHDSALGQILRYRHGQTVRCRRKVPVEQRCRAEYQHLSRKALEEATWPGVTEDEYVLLRRTVATERSA
jgi:hypothetical protein